MFKYLYIILFLLAVPLSLNAQASEVSLRGEVVKILESRQFNREDGSQGTQQDVRVMLLSGENAGEEVDVRGIGELEVVSAQLYESGDKVILQAHEDAGGNFQYTIIDRVRTPALVWLAGLFALIIILVGRFKGLKALLGLGLSFVVIMKLIIPMVLAGNNPLVVGLFGSLLILLLLIYMTEGFNRISHVSIFSILISLFITGLCAWIFVVWTSLSGGSSDEVMYLLGMGSGMLDLRGLLLTGILIGALGVLDDVVVSQVSLVQEMKKANPEFLKREVYQRAMKVGVTHIGAMTNTLFLAYAGASLPLLLLFAATNPPFVTIGDVFNNELIATEIVRTLTGSIGLALAAPIATLLAVIYIHPDK